MTDVCSECGSSISCDTCGTRPNEKDDTSEVKLLVGGYARHTFDCNQRYGPCICGANERALIMLLTQVAVAVNKLTDTLRHRANESSRDQI